MHFAMHAYVRICVTIFHMLPAFLYVLCVYFVCMLRCTLLCLGDFYIGSAFSSHFVHMFVVFCGYCIKLYLYIYICIFVYMWDAFCNACILFAFSEQLFTCCQCFCVFACILYTFVMNFAMCASCPHWINITACACGWASLGSGLGLRDGCGFFWGRLAAALFSARLGLALPSARLLPFCLYRLGFRSGSAQLSACLGSAPLSMCFEVPCKN